MSEKSITDSRPVILAIETSGIGGSVAIVSGSRCLAENTLVSRTTHSRRILIEIEQLVSNTGYQWSEIDGLAVSLGPGSFTGLRIGLSTAKGLAMATGKPLLGVPTLDGLASQFTFPKHQICPILDARKQEVYTALYRCAANGDNIRTGNYLALKPLALAERIDQPTIFVGDGIIPYRDIFTEVLGEKAIFAPLSLYFPRAAAIGMLAVKIWQKQDFTDPALVEPIYVRDSEAKLLFG
ncbi:MAG: tRNA (adenosine(37)-N6)-threonylcarbamoyltransferase complex dimerization subunit type 1 TsaB [Proteobacteria bacterium]|nr:tRNA (adenosine(37)-N6)-threonylcarbamoyltransferase complex dimerization subunit type 1 TsaB [Pseudomonadota bacterium]MBU1715081.1 tRNA (adenosine(37)-N6)-threonylcarbamoyltransferase complex dimerization subunit type 1 TsaB [Pseudomonadota bacterium]